MSSARNSSGRWRRSARCARARTRPSPKRPVTPVDGVTDMTTTERGRLSLDAWKLVRQMLDDMTAVVEADAETELELIEGLRVLGRVTALCSELSLDVDAPKPFFFAMTTDARLIGGVNPDGEYPLAMIDGRYRYRIRGRRGTTAYLGFQVLAGSGLTPRRMAAYVSDRDLNVRDDGTFSLVFAANEPT